MSNNSDLTPYENQSTSTSGSTGSGIATACIIGAAVGAAAVCKWLSEETEAEKEACAELKATRIQERLSGVRNCGQLHVQDRHIPGFSQVNLYLNNPKSLVQTAENLGYSVQHLPAEKTMHKPDCIFLKNPLGNKIVIEKNDAGRLCITTAGNLDPVHTLVRQHTMDRTLEHLHRAGLQVETTPLPNGGVQINAHGNSPRVLNGPAQIKTQVRADGSLSVDIDKVKGNRCETIVRDIASAVGAKVTHTQKKSTYFQLPGEPARTTIKL